MQLMKNLLLPCLLALLMGAQAALAETIRVGTTGDYRPVSWLNTATGNLEGEDIDLARAFGATSGLEIVFVSTTWPTLMADLGAEKFDMAVGGISYTDARAEAALVSDTVRTDGKVALVRCGEESSYRTLAQIDRPGVRVAENPGGTNESFARASLSAAQLTVMNDNHAPFAALLAGHADVMFTDGIEADYLQNTGSGLCNASKAAPFTEIRKIFLFGKNHAKLRDQFNSWLTAHP